MLKTGYFAWKLQLWFFLIVCSGARLIQKFDSDPFDHGMNSPQLLVLADGLQRSSQSGVWRIQGRREEMHGRQALRKRSDTVIRRMQIQHGKRHEENMGVPFSCGKMFANLLMSLRNGP